MVVLIPLIVRAQETPTGEIEDAQIIIEKDKPLTLPKANRLYKKTEVIPMETDSVKLEYDISSPIYQFDPIVFRLQRTPFRASQSAHSDYNYLKVGFGNYLSPRVQGYAGVMQNGNSAGLSLRHESFARGPVRDEESAYSKTNVGLNGTYGFDELTLSTQVNYQREAFYFFGYDPDGGPVAPTFPVLSDNRVNSHHLSFSPELYSNDDADVSFYVKPLLRFTDMRLNEGSFNREFQTGINTGLDFALSETLTGQLDVRYHYLSYQSGWEQTRNIFDLNPKVVLNQDRLKLQGGLSFALASDSTGGESRAYVYPDISADYQVNEDLAAYLSISGGMQPQSLEMTLTDNRYLDDSLTLLNQNEKIRINAGVKFGFLENWLLEPFITYSGTENRALFAHSQIDSSRFTLRYDRGVFGQTEMGTRITFTTSKTTVLAEMAFSSYAPDQLGEAWYLPATRMRLVATQTLGHQLSLKAQMIFLDGIKAPAPVTGLAVDMDAIFDLGLGARYDFSDRLSAFADVQNLIGVAYERYLNYPSRGITAKGGFIYRF